MKRLMSLLMSLLLTAALMLPLTACSPKEAKPPFPTSLTTQLLETEVFSEELEPLEAELAWMLYGLDATTLTQEQRTGASIFRSTGATCEEIALFTFADEAAAQTAADALDRYLTAQIEINKDYRPAELPKLKQAVLERRGTTVLLLVANDYQATHELLTP